MKISRSLSLPMFFGLLLTVLLFSAIGKVQASREGEQAHGPVPFQQALSESAQDENLFAAYFDMQIPKYLNENGIVGAVVTVVQNGEIAFTEGYGYANLEHGIVMDPERSVIHIGSAGKTFTAVAVMQLVEQGLVDLDADVNTYLDFEIPATYPEPITVRRLLTHTAGFEAYDLNIIVTDPARVPTSREFLINNLPERVRPPGEAIGYSNYGMALLGYVVERVSGISLSDYLDSAILAPLRMTHSSAQIMPPASLVEDMALGYRGGKPQPVEYIPAFGAAPVRATAADMAAYLNANLQLGQAGSTRILEPETSLSMQTRQYSADPRVNGIGFSFYEMSCNGQRILGHLGTTQNFHTLMFMLPAEQLGVLVSFNSAEAVSLMPGGIVLHDFMDHFYPYEVPYLTPPTDFADRTNQYTGVYFLNNRHSATTVEKMLFLTDAIRIDAPGDGSLRLTIGGVTRPYIEIEPDVFQQQGDDTLLVFHRDKAGQVTSASLSSRAVFTLERRPWYEAPRLTFAALLATGLIFVLGILAVLIGFSRSSTGVSPIGTWSALLIPVLNLAFTIGLVLLIPTIGKGVPETMLRLVLLLPMMAAVLTLVLVGVAAMMWFQRDGSLFARLHFSLLAVAGTVFVLVLHIWNLLGWRL